MSTNDLTFSEGLSPLACSNCCELLLPMTRADSGDCDPNQGFESHLVYELTHEEQVLAISSVLEKIYRFEQLRDLNDFEEELVENTPLCQKCANILAQMDILHQEFDRLRGWESYLSTKISKVDEIIRDRIVDLNLRLVTEDDNTRVPEDSQVVVKTEPEEPSEILYPSGPWVVLKRLRPEEIPEPPEVSSEDLSLDPLDYDGSDNFSNVDFEPVYNEEDVLFDIQDDDRTSYKKRRCSKRNVSRSGAQSSQLAENIDGSVGRTTKKWTSTKMSSQKVDKGNKKRTKEARSKYVHIQAENVECPECHQTTKSQMHFKRHFRKMHTPEGHRIYKKLMQRKSAKQSEIRRRNRIATSVCLKCNIDFQTVNRYKNHFNEVHITNKTWKWQCELCGKGFNDRNTFRSHQRFVHTDERPFICDQCGARFKRDKNLRGHMKDIHTEEGRLKCKEYRKANHRRKKRLAEELKTKGVSMDSGEKPLHEVLQTPAPATTDSCSQ